MKKIRNRVVLIAMALIMAASFSVPSVFADTEEAEQDQVNSIEMQQDEIETTDSINDTENFEEIPMIIEETEDTEEQGGEELQDAVAPVTVFSLKWSKSDIVLSWDAVEGAEGYELYRSKESKKEENFELLAEITPEQALTYTDSGRSKEYVYFYKVSTYITDQESGERQYSEDSKILNSVKTAYRIPIMTYHHLCRASAYKHVKSYRSLYVTDKAFRSQMNWLKNHGWRTISTDEIAKWYNREIELPYKSTLITFDDGCYSVLKFAYPVLKKNKQKATIFMQGNRTSKRTNTSCRSGYKYRYIGKDKMASVRKNYPNLEFQSHTWKMHDRIRGKKPVKVMTQAQMAADCAKMHNKFGYTAIAYPWGTYNTKMKNALRENGNYIVAFTYGTDKYARRSQSKFALKRIKVRGGASLSKFKKWYK